MNCRNVTYKLHAVEQMFKRNLTQPEVELVIKHGETIAEYPNDNLIRVFYVWPL